MSQPGEISLHEILYSYRVFSVLPNELADFAQTTCEDVMVQCLNELTTEVQGFTEFKTEFDANAVLDEVIGECRDLYDRALDKMEEEFVSFMKIPSHVLLEGDQFLRRCTNNEGNNIEDALVLKQRRIEIQESIKKQMQQIRDLQKEIRNCKREQERQKRLKIINKYLSMILEGF